MPWMVREGSDGEPVWVDPAPRKPTKVRDRARAKLRRMRRLLVWWDLVEVKGLKAVEVADTMEVSLSTLRTGLAECRAWLIEEGYLEGPDREAADRLPIQPFYGPRPIDVTTGELLATGRCGNCGGTVRHEALVCGVCHATKASVGRRINEALNVALPLEGPAGPPRIDTAGRVLDEKDPLGRGYRVPESESPKPRILDN